MNRFWSKVDRNGTGGCWTWTGAKDRDGYGRFRVDRIRVGAHRVSYEASRGAVPDGLEIDQVNGRLARRIADLAIRMTRRIHTSGTAVDIAESATGVTCGKTKERCAPL